MTQYSRDNFVYWEQKPAKNLNLDILPLQNQRMTPFKQMKKVHLIPICYQRAEELLTTSYNNQSSISPIRNNGLFDNSKGFQTHSKLGNKLSQGSQGGIPDLNEDLDRLTVDSNVLNITPKQYLDSKFYQSFGKSNGVMSPQNIQSPTDGVIQGETDSLNPNDSVFSKDKKYRAKITYNREKIEPAVVELSSAGPEDMFKRQKLLFFQPQFSPTNGQLTNNNMTHVLNIENSIEFSEGSIKASPRVEKPLLLYQSMRKIKKQMGNKQVSRVKKANFQISNQNQDLKLTKYLSPMKQHYRIAYKDQSEHQKQLSNINLNFSMDDLSSNDLCFSKRSNPLQLSESHKEDESKLFVNMLKQYKDKRHDLFSQQIKEQSRDIDNIFRNHNHDQPTSLSFKQALDEEHQDVRSSPKYHHKIIDRIQHKASRRVFSQAKIQLNGTSSGEIPIYSPHHDHKFSVQDQIRLNQQIIHQELEKNRKRGSVIEESKNLINPLQPHITSNRNLNENEKLLNIKAQRILQETINQINSTSLLKKKRRNRLNFEREQLMALAVPGYLDYVFNLK